MSVLQSAVFNDLLAERVDDGTFAGVVDGDLCRKEDSGGLFVAEDLAEAQRRASRFEISATGPMFGSKMRAPAAEAAAREAAVAERWGLTEERIRAFGPAGAGTRRPLRTPLRDASVEAEPDGLRFRFTLPPGAYATVVLREITRGVEP